MQRDSDVPGLVIAAPPDARIAPWVAPHADHVRRIVNEGRCIARSVVNGVPLGA